MGKKKSTAMLEEIQFDLVVKEALSKHTNKGKYKKEVDRFNHTKIKL